MRRWMAYLDGVIAGDDPAVLDLDVRRGMGKLAFGVGPRAFVPLVLAAYLQLQPARVLHAAHQGHAASAAPAIHT